MFTHTIPPSWKRKEIITSLGSIWINSTIFREIEEAQRIKEEELWDKTKFLTKRKQDKYY